MPIRTDDVAQRQRQKPYAGARNDCSGENHGTDYDRQDRNLATGYFFDVEFPTTNSLKK